METEFKAKLKPSLNLQIQKHRCVGTLWTLWTLWTKFYVHKVHRVHKVHKVHFFDAQTEVAPLFF